MFASVRLHSGPYRLTYGRGQRRRLPARSNRISENCPKNQLSRNVGVNFLCDSIVEIIYYIHIFYIEFTIEKSNLFIKFRVQSFPPGTQGEGARARERFRLREDSLVFAFFVASLQGSSPITMSVTSVRPSVLFGLKMVIDCPFCQETGRLAVSMLATRTA